MLSHPGSPALTLPTSEAYPQAVRYKRGRCRGRWHLRVRKTFSYLAMTTDSHVAQGEERDLVLKECKHFFKLGLLVNTFTQRWPAVVQTGGCFPVLPKLHFVRSGSVNLRPGSHLQPATCSCKIQFIRTQPCLCVFVRGVYYSGAVTEMVWPS